MQQLSIADNMRSQALPLLLSVLFFLVPFALAVFADEAFRSDYQHVLVGTPQAHTTFFHRPSAASKASLLYTLSEKSILGAINPRDGSFVWRQDLREGGDNGTTFGGYLKAGGAENTIVSGTEAGVRAWDAADGRLIWECSIIGKVKGLEVLEIEGTNKDVLALSHKDDKTLVSRLSSSTGQIIWQYVDQRLAIVKSRNPDVIQITDGHSGDVPQELSASATRVYYVSIHSTLLTGSKIIVTALDATSATQHGQHTFNCDNKDPILQASSNSAAPILVWADSTFKTLKINLLGSKHVTTITTEDHGEDVEAVVLHAPNSINAQAHFLLHYQTSKSNWAEVYHIDLSSSSVQKSYDLPRLGGKGAFSTNSVDANVFFARNTDFETVLVSSASHGVLERWPVRPKSHGGLVNPEGIASAASEVVSRGDSRFAVRSAVALSSGDWHLIRNGEPIWLRPESLAGVVAAGWAEIPIEEDLVRELTAESQDNVLSAYIHRVRRHARDLQRLPVWIAKLPFRVFGGLLGDEGSSDGQTLQRDNFGFNKVVIVVTEKGRVMALDTRADGRILWSTQAITVPANARWQVKNIEVGDKVAIITAVNGEYVIVESLTGNIRKYQPPELTSDIDTFITLPGDVLESNRIVIDKDGVPSVPKGVLGKSTTIVTKLSSGSIAGWSSFGKPKCSLAWEFATLQDEEIRSVITRPAHDPVASIGKVLGDRNVLYKYLNPNLVLITATSLVAATLSVYLLDAISGQTLYTNTHTGVDTTKAIATTLSENWFTYTLYSDPSILMTNSSSYDPLPKGYQLIISELYESPFPNDRGPLESAKNFSTLNTNPDIAAVPHVFSQSYVLPGPISRLTTTSTLQGITPRSILCVLPTLSALLALPVTFLSPRRPINRDPTAAEAEEGLYKYNPILDFNPQWMITHKREVLGLKGVITTPTLMESTSLVFAYGDVDVFGTRVAPIGTFDVLGKGFSRLQLVGTVVALAVGTGILAPMVSRSVDPSAY